MARLLIIGFGAGDAGQMGGFAQKLGLPYDLLQLSGDAAGIGAEKAMTAGLDEIPVADGLAKALTGVCGGYTHIAAVSSMKSKDLLARLAGLLDAAMVTDAVDLESPTTYHRPIVAGSAISKVEVLAEPVVITVRPAGFPKPDTAGNGGTESVSLSIESKAQRISESGRGGGGRPDLTQANVVVSGGRPLKDAETFERLVGGLADKLGGAAGATRAAVDSGIASNELQVGQTGKIVAPNLYIAAGISGSTQHLAGIKDSKVIVAINTDGDAPIFEAADYGLVGDLYDVIPELMQKI